MNAITSENTDEIKILQKQLDEAKEKYREVKFSNKIICKIS